MAKDCNSNDIREGDLVRQVYVLSGISKKVFKVWAIKNSQPTYDDYVVLCDPVDNDYSQVRPAHCIEICPCTLLARVARNLRSA